MPDAPLRVMFAGHADQIGLIVSHINENGYIYTNTIGGWDPQQLIGQRMTIYTADGPVPAVIARKPIHLLDEEERKQVVKQKELWLDIGAKDRDEAAKAVAIGDPVTLELGYQEMRNNLANSPGMDNKTGLWVCVEALRRAQKRGGLNVALYAVSTVQEEIGLRGAITSAYGINPHVGVAVDVTHATDCPTIDKTQEGDIKLGGGPVIYRGPNMNPHVVDRLRAAAEAAKIAVPMGRQRPRHRHRRQRHPARPRRRRGRADQHAQPLHAQRGRDDLARRHRPARPICWPSSPSASKPTPISRRDRQATIGRRLTPWPPNSNGPAWQLDKASLKVPFGRCPTDAKPRRQPASGPGRRPATVECHW